MDDDSQTELESRLDGGLEPEGYSFEESMCSDCYDKNDRRRLADRCACCFLLLFRFVVLYFKSCILVGDLWFSYAHILSAFLSLKHISIIMIN